MKLSQIILEGPFDVHPLYVKEVEKLRKKGGRYLGSGDYGSVYRVRNVAIKVTTDEIELDHAELLKKKHTKYFVYIYDVKRIADKVGVITMELLDPYNKKVPEEFIENLKKEAESLGISSDELDLQSGDIMIDKVTGNLKMIDV